MLITANAIREGLGRGKRPEPNQNPLARTFKLLGEQVGTLLRTLLILLIALAAVAPSLGNAQEEATAPRNKSLAAHNKSQYGGVKRILLRSAEQMPEKNYSFKPTASVRSFGQIVGHVADSQYAFCSIVLGEKNPSPNIEKTKTSKGDLIAALRDAFAYCDKAYDGMTDESGVEMVKFMGGENPKLGVLYTNNTHTIEHYGNLVTYMRIKRLVPPTSDPEFMKQLSK